MSFIYREYCFNNKEPEPMIRLFNMLVGFLEYSRLAARLREFEENVRNEVAYQMFILYISSIFTVQLIYIVTASTFIVFMMTPPI